MNACNYACINLYKIICKRVGIIVRIYVRMYGTMRVLLYECISIIILVVMYVYC